MHNIVHARISEKRIPLYPPFSRGEVDASGRSVIQRKLESIFLGISGLWKWIPAFAGMTVRAGVR